MITQLARSMVTVLNDLLPPSTVEWMTLRVYSFTSELLCAFTVIVLPALTKLELSD